MTIAEREKEADTVGELLDRLRLYAAHVERDGDLLRFLHRLDLLRQELRVAIDQSDARTIDDILSAEPLGAVHEEAISG